MSGAGFRITSALWDKIHHFASFPQTGGECLCHRLFAAHPACSVPSADGPVRPKSLAGHAPQGVAVPRRYAVALHPNRALIALRGAACATRPPRQGAVRASPRPGRHAQHQEGPEL
ncbi:hypothetical protein H0H87_000928, partial [Tephrocybe sp. NHM501043]